jgi:TldD protein
LLLSRRNFLKQGSTGVLGMTLLSCFTKSGRNIVAAVEGGKKMTLNDYYNYFGISEKIVHEVMAGGLSRGGDYCDLFFEHTIYNYIGLEDEAVNHAYTKISMGTGIRVLKGDQTGYSFTEELTPESMKLAAQTAANIACGTKKVDPVPFKLHKHSNYYPIKIPWEEVGIDKKIPYLKSLNEKVFSLDPRIVKSKISFTNETSYILIINSKGRIVFDYRPMGQIGVTCTAEQDGIREQNFFSLSGRRGIEFFSPENLNQLANKAVKKTTDLFEAVKPEGGEMEVVLASGSSGILLHEAIGHGMEADYNRKKISIFCDKMNQRVAKDFVTIVDDGTNQNIRGSINIDDEGNDTEVTYLVEKGILRNYLHDMVSANYYRVKPTGNGRRESFRYAPNPRMRNTYMMPGPHKKEEIIKSVKRGLYAETFTNGQVLIGAGDFTFYVKSGYLIENGKLTKPVKDINIIGNGPEVLRNIVMVADDLKMAEGGWTCGKDGQGVPVSQGLPTVKVSKITVGGIDA